MPKLIYNDPDTGSRVVVEIDSEMSEVTVGRNPGNIIRINNPSVSRRHTKFVYEHGEVTLYDLNSSNGTYVNGMRIQEQVLEDGDLVRVGEFPLEFVHEEDLASTQVEEGQVVEEFQQQGGGDGGMKSTHMGVGAMGMEESEGRGGEMAPATGGSQTRQEFSDVETGQQPAGGGDEDAEFILDEDDIQEVTEAGEVEEEDVHQQVAELDSLGAEMDDATVEASVQEVTNAEAGDGSIAFGESGSDSDDVQTRRADGDAIAAQLQGSVEEETRAEGDGSEVAELQQQIAKLRAELEKAPDREEFDAVVDQRDEARQQVSQLEADLRDRDDRIENLEGRLDERNSTIEQLEESVQKLEADLRDRESDIEVLEADVERLEQQDTGDGAGDEELRAELEQQEEELEKLREQVAAFDEEREKKKAIFEELSGDLRELVGKKGELEDRVDELEEQLQTVRAERDSLLETIDQLEDGHQGGGGGSAEDSQEYRELLEEKESLEETLAEVILERDQLEDQLQEARESS